jgi:hypothetical protein
MSLRERAASENGPEFQDEDKYEGPILVKKPRPSFAQVR